jgi:hypothetical protein
MAPEAKKEVTHANCAPIEFGHQLRNVPVTTCRTLSLLNLQDVHQRRVAKGSESVLEQIWLSRDCRLDKVPRL